VRASVKIPSLESRVMDDVGYLRIQDFPIPALYDDVLTELNHFNDLALKGLILDLRANSGGRTDVGSRVASLFLERDTPIYTSTTRRGQTTERRATPPNQIWTRPVTVLIDGGTASMGEILAASLQEQGIAQLVGETTAGAVAGSIVVPLSNGAALQVTTVRIDTGLGQVLNNIGVVPDLPIEVAPETLRSGLDPQLDVAMSVLRAEINAAAGQSPVTTAPTATATPASTQTATATPAPSQTAPVTPVTPQVTTGTPVPTQPATGTPVSTPLPTGTPASSPVPSGTPATTQPTTATPVPATSTTLVP
jgi:C-terminal processing protease CtpA/Prc